MDLRGSEIVSLSLAVLVACAVLFPLLGHRPLTDWDEGIYAEISREMLSGGWRNLLVPHWNGHLWFEKPPLLMWLTAASLRAFGLTAFAARLPSALAGVGIVGLLHGWLRRRLGDIAAWLSTLLLLSAFGFQHAARAGETDTLLSFGCLLSLIGLAEAGADRGRGWWLFWIGFSVALMTKGAASVVLPLSLLAFAAMQRELRYRRAFWLGLAMFGALTMPWHLWMYLHFGQAFLSDYLGFHVIGRATGAIEGHSTHPWFYLWVLLISAPPFALFYPWALAGPFQRSELRLLRPFAIFAVIVVALFTAVQTRLPHYIAPAYPEFSALTGAVLSLGLRRWLPLRRAPVMRFAGGAVALYVFAAVATAGARRSLHSAHLPNGFATPDNREAVELLGKARGQAAAVPGPLLVWRQGMVVPVTTDAFYARRLAQQVSLDSGSTGATPDRYYFSPVPLIEALPPGEARLMLMDKALAPKLPPHYRFTALAIGPSELAGIVFEGPIHKESGNDR